MGSTHHNKPKQPNGIDQARVIYRLDENLEPVERIPIGSLNSPVFFDENSILRVYDDSSSPDQDSSSYIDMFISLQQSRMISYEFCKDASCDEIRNLEISCKTTEFLDLASNRWGDFRIIFPGPIDELGATMTISGDPNLGYSNLSRTLQAEELISYREIIDDYNFLRSTFLNARCKATSQNCSNSWSRRTWWQIVTHVCH